MKHFITLLLTSFMLLSTQAHAWAPTKPVEVIIGWNPGSGNELVFRALAAEVEKNTGAKFVIINKNGAGATIATRYLAAQKPDGHTISVVISKGISVQDKINVPDQTNRGYTVDDFTYLMLPAVNQFAIIANVKDSINGPQDLVNALNNEQLTFIAGGGSRLVYEVLKETTKFKDVVHLNDNGPVQAITEIIGGHARLAIVPTLVAGTYHNSGRIKIIATSGTSRVFSKVGTVSESLPGFEVTTGWGIVAPKGLPAEIQEWYLVEFRKALQSESVKAFWKNNFLEVSNKLITPDGYQAYVKSSEARYAKTVDRVAKEIHQKQ